MGLTKSTIYKKPEYTITTSWDDGGILDIKIAELLSRYNLPGTFYPVVDWIGKEGYMSWQQIIELDKKGFNIGSHTMSHPQDLKPLFDEQLFFEIQNSKDLIETALGHKISSFCYPRGRFDERVRDKVVEAGYVEARGTGTPGITVVKDKYALPGTIHIFQRQEYGNKTIYDFASGVLKLLKQTGGYCNIWGHSAEIEKNDLWDTLEAIFIEVKRL